LTELYQATEQFAKLPQTRTKEADAQIARLESLLATFTGSPTIQQLLATTAGGDDAHPAARALSLRVMANTKLAELPRLWADTLTKLLDPNGTLIGPAVTAPALPPTKEPHEELRMRTSRRITPASPISRLDRGCRRRRAGAGR
jgi:hypothetical protein